MSVVVAPQAEARFLECLKHVAEKGDSVAAERLFLRVEKFFATELQKPTLAEREVRGRRCLQRQIPGTRFIIWYRCEAGTTSVLDFWHTSQERDPIR